MDRSQNRRESSGIVQTAQYQPTLNFIDRPSAGKGEPLRSFTHDPRASRLIRERMAADTSIPRIRGYAVAIDFLDGYAADARVIEASTPLFPEKVAGTEGEKGDRRRFGFVQYAGESRPPLTGLVRHVGDAFFADRRTADFVWQAVIEKIENDATGLRGAPQVTFPR